MSQEKQLIPLQIQEIAAWWTELRREGVQPQNDVEYATLPAIQRGFVWNAEQIETVWDSIVRGFPVGSLMLAEFSQAAKEQHGLKAKQGEVQPDNKEPSHYLLDGQQRSTSIAIGFRNVWSGECQNRDEIHSALWVDIKAHNKDRRFLFRLVTQSHPWGYSRENPRDTLSAAKTSSALVAFRDSLGEERKRRPNEFKIYQVFPWDAEAPLPLALVLEAVGKHGEHIANVKSELRKSLSRAELWKNQDTLAKSKAFLDDKDDGVNFANLATGFSELVQGLHMAMTKYKIPAIILPAQDQNITQINDLEDAHDPTFTLFERINTKGTALSKEEIKYSLLKSAWPDAPYVIEDKLLSKRHFSRPARMVSLMSRLYMMTKDSSEPKRLQAELSMKQFREMVQEIKEGKELQEEDRSFKGFCINRGMSIVENVWDLLTGGQHGLPKVLAAQLTQGASDLVLLLMYWVSRLNKDQLENLKNEKGQIRIRRMLGFITAVAWFAPDPSRCARSLADKLTMLHDISDVISFFDRSQFHEVLCREGPSDPLQMIPLPTPEALQDTLLYKDLIQELKNPSTGGLWGKQFWEHYGVDQTPGHILDMFKKHWGSDDNINEWYKLVKDRLTSDHHLLLYAQRKYVSEWFEWFDPTQPDQIRDRNRPWDYDHILPKSWTHPGSSQSRIGADFPQLVRIWVWAIGNFRAWPLEHNRSKGNIAMIEDGADMEDYDLGNIIDVLEASFIRESGGREDWLALNEQLSRDADQPKKLFYEAGGHWALFVRASIIRSVDIYREWYDELKIAYLMGNVDNG